MYSDEHATDVGYALDKPDGKIRTCHGNMNVQELVGVIPSTCVSPMKVAGSVDICEDAHHISWFVPGIKYDHDFST